MSAVPAALGHKALVWDLMRWVLLLLLLLLLLELLQLPAIQADQVRQLLPFSEAVCCGAVHETIVLLLLLSLL
jgi:hypothetical protein